MIYRDRKDAGRYLGEGTIRRIIQQQQEEIVRRIQRLRGGRDLPALEGRTVILVDDGIAMGSLCTCDRRLKRACGKIEIKKEVHAACCLAK
jgi:predicted phosphoribosyltransferase